MNKQIPSPRNVLRLAAAALLGVLCAAAMAEDLSQVFTQALDSDPEFLRQTAAKRATLERKPQAISQLLPNVAGSGYTTENSQDISAAFIIGDEGNVDFNSRGYSLDLRQPLFRYDRFLRLGQADSEIRQADAQVAAALQDLMVRVSERYFLVLGLGDNLQFTEAEKRSLARQLEQAQQRFEVGLTAITDVQEAQAGYDRAVAQEIAAANDVDNARESLREITGVYYDSLALLGDKLPLVEPTPADIDTWTTMAVEQNLNVQAAISGVEVARREIKVRNSEHLPTLDLVARYGYDRSGGRFGATKVHSDAFGLQLNVPIYEGGFVSSRSREAQADLDAELQFLEQSRRNAQRLTRQAYLGVISGISQVHAFNQALISSETALEATEAGFEVGTRTAVDVIAAERVLSQAKRDYARAKYDYILNTLRLKQAAGTLSDQDIALVNQWLQ